MVVSPGFCAKGTWEAHDVGRTTRDSEENV